MKFWNKRYVVFPIDVSFMILSYFLAHVIRFENFDFLELGVEFWIGMTIVIFVRSIVFFSSNIYRSLWAYASIHDLVEIIKTTLLSSLLSTVCLLFYNRFQHFSRIVPVLDTILLLSFLCLRSFSWRLFRDQYLMPKDKSGKTTILIGAGKAGILLLSELRNQNELGLKPIGFLDDDNNTQGAHIHGFPVLGRIHDLTEIITIERIEMVIITKSNLPSKDITFILNTCEEFKVEVKILPSFSDLINPDPRAKLNQIREVRVEDLLGRESVDLEIDSIRSYLTKHVILITGAGGSIGSEICRQVSVFSPSSIVILDSGETPLYEIDYELRNKFQNIEFISIVADVKNLSRLSYIFDLYKPTVVFHCAAYKHVPLMEINPSEAILNNILGTKNIADISRLSGVERFVLISTDKAVNPVNIMGASKRTSELYIQHIAHSSKTKFITVRFGNVLGSNGSVIPRFKEQIQKGGPVTVTHPDVIRYFMTIPEASQLVLQAGSMGNRGEIFILDMGEPVRILELAEEMIRLSGFRPYKDIDIQFTGLRPGEKLFEELLLDLEGIKPTHHPKIRIAAPTEFISQLQFQNKLNALFSLAKANKNKEIFDLFKDIIPEYTKHNEYISTETNSKIGS
ncbi:MAG: nucleoside-diphosphate sugar epimerase/dehydratase [Leptospiraceae bacterium]|nr:nucleoside-diphosphate sugar epimerase/dehydratase [Leptospiraceae bacterium]